MAKISRIEYPLFLAKISQIVFDGPVKKNDHFIEYLSTVFDGIRFFSSNTILPRLSQLLGVFDGIRFLSSNTTIVFDAFDSPLQGNRISNYADESNSECVFFLWFFLTSIGIGGLLTVGVCFRDKNDYTADPLRLDYGIEASTI